MAGIFVGYHLQPGGLWKREYLVFPRDRFGDYDFETPRHLNNLVPARVREVKVTDAIPRFMMKEGYDRARRTLSPKTIINIKDNCPTEEDILSEDYVPTEDISDEDNSQPNSVEATSEPEQLGPPTAPPPHTSEVHGLSKHPDFHEWRKDARGRRYAYDVYGNRLRGKPGVPRQRPAGLPRDEWQRMSPTAREAIVGYEKQRLANLQGTTKETSSPSYSSGDHVSTAAYTIGDIQNKTTYRKKLRSRSQRLSKRTTRRTTKVTHQQLAMLFATLSTLLDTGARSKDDDNILPANTTTHYDPGGREARPKDEDNILPANSTTHYNPGGHNARSKDDDDILPAGSKAHCDPGGSRKQLG